VEVVGRRVQSDERVGADHAVQLFDTEESLAATVADFVTDGLRGLEGVLLVMTAPHVEMVRATLAARSVDLGAERRRGRVRVLDARDVLDRVVRWDGPDPGLLDEHVGTVVRTLVNQYGRVRVYGEVVDLLAIRGDFAEARQLEELWNAFRRLHPFYLLCGYSSVSFGSVSTTAALRALCAAHSSVCCSDADGLAEYLIESTAVDTRKVRI
jgi:hypothetical protein